MFSWPDLASDWSRLASGKCEEGVNQETRNPRKMNLCKSANGGDGISDIEGKAARASGERVGKRASFKFADEISLTKWRGDSYPKHSRDQVVAIRLWR